MRTAAVWSAANGPLFCLGLAVATLAACGGDDPAIVRKKSAGGGAGAAASGGQAAAGAAGNASAGAAGNVAAGAAGAASLGGSAGAAGSALAGTGGTAAGTGGSTAGSGGGPAGAGGGAGVNAGGASGATSGAGGAAAGAGGSAAGTGGSAAGTGGSAGGSCVGPDAPAGVPTKTMQISACSFEDGLGDLAVKQKVESVALGETGGVLSLFLAVADQSSVFDLTIRRYVVDTAGDCKLTRDMAYVPPTDLECETLSNDRAGGIWCAGTVAGPKVSYGFRRIWPAPTPLCTTSTTSTTTTKELVVDPDAKVVFGDFASRRRWTYTENGCAEDLALTTCVSGGGGIFGGAVDDQHHFHLRAFDNRVAVVDAQGKNLFSYGVAGDPLSSASACTTGVCGIRRNQSNLPLKLGGVDAKGALVLASDVERDYTSTKRTDLSSVGGRGILLLGEDGGSGADQTTRVIAQLLTGL